MPSVRIPMRKDCGPKNSRLIGRTCADDAYWPSDLSMPLDWIGLDWIGGSGALTAMNKGCIAAGCRFGKVPSVRARGWISPT